MDDGGDNKNETSQPTQVDPRDGSINFAAYSIEQLRELQHSIDRHTNPQNFRNLVAALEQKEAPAVASLPPGDTFVGRFTLRNGPLGWLEAKIHRSPVYGFGSIQILSTGISLTGWQRTWLGVPIESSVTREIANVRNVVEDGARVRFDVKRHYRPAERIEFQPESSAQCKPLVDKLPGLETAGFLSRWSMLREFNQVLDSVSGRPWITPIIVILNVALYLAMAIATKKPGAFNLQELLAWGANFGPLTVNGQWWRLFTALFVHFSALHLLVNMWALWNVGCLSERLFGRGTYLFLYIVTGLLASLTSIAWDPSLASVGASGAIFGIFGTFLAFLSRQRRQIPPAILRKHWMSTAAFVLFNLINGAIQPGIDNAAHVGGLLAGFALGFILARPLDREQRKRFPARQSAAAAGFVSLVVLAAIWQVRGIGSGLTIPEQYFREHSAYVSGEMKNLQLWNELAVRASAGSISDAELAERFERDILPFWQAQKDQLEKENESLKGPKRDFAGLVANFVDLRYQWANALIDATKNNDSGRAADAKRFMKAAMVAQAKLERIGIRVSMDHRLRALAATPLVIKARQFLTGRRWTCVNAPAIYGPVAANSDDKSDGPAVRGALGCRAQQLFMDGDYERLESLMNQYMGNLGDLPDGSSSYEGLVGGLTDLFGFGGLDPQIAFGHTADWRRRIKGSVMSDLVEAMFFSEWAYAARGTGYANSVSSQNMALYAHRTEMAAAGLAEVADRAANNPLWYSLSLEVGLDQAKDKTELREIFDQGFAKVPDYRPLYRRMLRVLMPRWGGSYREVDDFINSVYDKTAAQRSYERYAELYSSYAWAEGDELDLFRDTSAIWSSMSMGYVGLVKRHPASDSILNSFANFACRAGDTAEYNRLRSAVGKRFSSVAWTAKYSLDACDKQLGAGGEFHALRSLRDVPGGRVLALGGVRIGMTRQELLAAKGSPIHQEEKYWSYYSIDSKHNGVLTVVFSTPRQGSDGTVLAIAYTGDEASAPAELPYLTGMSSPEVLQAYGPQITGNLTLHAEMTFTFRNGIYVNTRDEKVYRYGIFGRP
jgi:membrane associated rhomboid family serine protease